jgi:hypothetical protein
MKLVNHLKQMDIRYKKKQLDQFDDDEEEPPVSTAVASLRFNEAFEGINEQILKQFVSTQLL